MTIRRTALVATGYFLVALGFLFAACDSMGNVPANITITAGDQQTAVAGSAVANPPAVRVSNNNDEPLEGASVSFAVQIGGGSVTNSTALTDVNGMASTGWTLGTTVGTNNLDATVGELSAVTFTATGDPGPPTIAAAGQGDNQSAPIGAMVTTAPEVVVTDANANGVVGVSVIFSVSAGGGTITDSVQTTDVNGVATLGGWTLGSLIGQQTLTAAVAGFMNDVIINATGLGDTTIVINISAGNNQTATVNTAVASPVQVFVTDNNSVPLVNQQVDFTVTGGGGSLTVASPTTDGAGIATLGSWSLGTTAGPNSINASIPGVLPVTFDANGTPDVANQLIVLPGASGQEVMVAENVILPPTVIVADQFSNGVSSVTVDFAVTGGGGSLTGSSVVSDANGRAAATSWTLGGSPGNNTVDATSAGLTAVQIAATGVAAGGYDIVMRTVGSVLPAVQTAMNATEARWESVIIGELSDIDFASQPFPPNSCVQVNNPLLSETVDDMLIWVEIVDIDGAGGVLGSAGFCAIRTSNSLPILGGIQLDSADAASLDASGLLDDVIIHEVGHILGFGTQWAGFLQNPSFPSDSGIDTHFNGPVAIAGFDAVGGTTYTAGEKVPVENEQGGQGTRDAHWRESTFNTEMMTGFLDNTTNPLSVMTVGSLNDLGYATNPGAADSYSVTFPFLRATGRSGIRLRDDVRRGPIFVVDDSGTVVRVIQPK